MVRPAIEQLAIQVESLQPGVAKLKFMTPLALSICFHLLSILNLTAEEVGIPHLLFRRACPFKEHSVLRTICHHALGKIQAGIISAKAAGDQRFMDTRADEQVLRTRLA